MSANAMTCYHEAGHAVAALACRIDFAEVRISGAGEGATRGFDRLEGASDGYLLSRFLTACGGPIAEALALADYRTGDNSLDAWHRGRELADTRCWSGDIRFIQTVHSRIPRLATQRAFDHALRRISQAWPAVQVVASVLGHRRVLSRDEIQILLSKGEN